MQKIATATIILTISLFIFPVMARADEAENFIAGGIAFNQYSVPQISGALLYAQRIGEGLYSYSLVDVVSKTVRPFVATTSITTGLAQHVRSIGKIRVYISGTGGVAAGGENLGFSWSAGGAAVVPLGGGWKLLPGVRVIKSSITDFQGVYSLMIGWGK